jgi:cobalt-zinc-cadmium efflux system protein
MTPASDSGQIKISEPRATHSHGDQPHDHHDHSGHSRNQASQRTLAIVLGLNLLYMLAEAIGGWLTNSLALLSDAGHMLTDVIALALSLVAAGVASRPATVSKTYGFYRLEILAALANGVTLIALSLLICYEAWHRFHNPEPVGAGIMIWIAAGGLLINLLSARLLSHHHAHSLNLRGAFLHVLSDLLGSAVAVLAGALILWRGWVWADPLFSVIISLLIIISSWKLVADAVNVLLEATPAHIDVMEVEKAMRQVSGVLTTHDLHIWTLTSNRHIITAHVVVDDLRAGTRILRELRQLLAQRFHLDHSTIQLEDQLFSAVQPELKRKASGNQD